MNNNRLRYYLAQAGCDDERLGAHSPPGRRCDEALTALGFTPEQLDRIDRSVRKHRVGLIASAAVFQTANVVAFGLAVHRYQQTLSGLSLIVENWDAIKLAYSVADTIGWDTTADLVIVTATHSIPIAAFLLEHSEEMQGLANALGVGAELAAVKADLADALITGGLSIGFSVLAWGFVKWLNAEPRRRLQELESRTRPVQALHVMLAAGALPKAVREQLPLVPGAVSEMRAAA
ncbi:hypothetical protein ACFY36_04315 [Actinoplanes sp. NPDC000266]